MVCGAECSWEHLPDGRFISHPLRRCVLEKCPQILWHSSYGKTGFIYTLLNAGLSLWLVSNQQNAAQWWHGTSKAGLRHQNFCLVPFLWGRLPLEIVPRPWGSLAAPAPAEVPAENQPALASHRQRGETSRWPNVSLWSPHWTLPKVVISEQSESCWCFKPLSFEVFCLSVIANQNCSQVLLFPVMQKVNHSEIIGRSLSHHPIMFSSITFITICNYSLYLLIHIFSSLLPLEQKLPGYSDLTSVYHHLAQHLACGEPIKYTCEK